MKARETEVRIVTSSSNDGKLSALINLVHTAYNVVLFLCSLLIYTFTLLSKVSTCLM